MQELIITPAQQIEDAQLRVLRNSQFYGLMTDESTDVSITKELFLYGRFIYEERDALLISLMDASKKQFDPI